MDGYCDECCKYAQVLGKQPDGTTIYRCYECGRMWAEKLVVFDVSFALAEHTHRSGAEPDAREGGVLLAAAELAPPRNGGVLS